MTQLPFESCLTGLVREVTLAGAGFLRIDVFEGSDCEAKAHLDAIDKGFAGLGLVKFCGKHIHNITVDGAKLHDQLFHRRTLQFETEADDANS